jgi:hypothetical protein
MFFFPTLGMRNWLKYSSKRNGTFCSKINLNLQIKIGEYFM